MPNPDPSRSWLRRLPMAPRLRASLGLIALSAVVAIAAGTTRWLRDGSLWLDEASIAVNLLAQGPTEILFGPLETGHSFPRLYLLAIQGLSALFGDHTIVLRALPFAAFVGWVGVCHRLAWQRFGREPWLLALLLVLFLIPNTGFVFAAMLKQYTWDALLAVLPFLLPDAFFERHLRRGEQRWRLLLCIAPVLASFTYVIPLLARVLAWAFFQRARGPLQVDRRAAIGFAAGTGAALLGLWMIDVRHSALEPMLLNFWAACIPDGSPAHDLEILIAMFRRWYTGALPWQRTSMPALIAGLLPLAALGGSLEIVRRTLRPAIHAGDRDDAVAGAPDIDAWGSRSLAALITIGGLFAAGYVVRYPVCAGRVTLFALFASQLLMLEGVAGLGAWLQRRSPRARRMFPLLVVTFVLACLPTAWQSLRGTFTQALPENVRPVLHISDHYPKLPILVAACSTRQIRTLPEWRDRDDLYYFDELPGSFLQRLPHQREFLVVSAGSARYCPWFFEQLDRVTQWQGEFQVLGNRGIMQRVLLSDEAVAERQAGMLYPRTPEIRRGPRARHTR